MTTSNERQHILDENLKSQTTYTGWQPQITDNIYRMTTANQRQHKLDTNLKSKTTYTIWHPPIKDNFNKRHILWSISKTLLLTFKYCIVLNIFQWKVQAFNNSSSFQKTIYIPWTDVWRTKLCSLCETFKTDF